MVSGLRPLVNIYPQLQTPSIRTIVSEISSCSSETRGRTRSPKMATTEVLQHSTTGMPDEHTVLQLTSAYGPVYRTIKTAPPRDATPEEIPIIPHFQR